MFGNTMQAKLASMVVIGGGSFGLGVIPACFVSRVQYLQRRLLLSCALCFGAGVLMATSILHVLPEARRGFPKYAELVFSCGFLVLYLVDECVHYLCWKDNHGSQTNARNPRQRNTQEQSRDCRNNYYGTAYNAAYAQNRKIHIPEGDSTSPITYRQNIGGSENDNWMANNSSAVRFTRECHPASEETTHLCNGNHNEEYIDSNTGLAGLAFALIVHAILEGLAIGLQTQIPEVLLLAGAVASHKFVVAFCFGLELARTSKSISRLVLVIFLFSGGSVIGIGIGMITFQMHTDWSELALPILQALAGGTLLYVTVSEVLPRERMRWHKNPRRYAGILQFLSVVTGFVVIFLLNHYVGT